MYKHCPPSSPSRFLSLLPSLLSPGRGHRTFRPHTLRAVRGSAIVGSLRDRAAGHVGRNLLDIPQLGKLQSAWAVSVGLFDLDDDPLQMLGIVIGMIQRQSDVAPIQRFLVDDRRSTVDPDGLV